MSSKDLTAGRDGILFCLVGPTGSGKSTVVRELLKIEPQTLRPSISVTSRAPRAGEKNEVDYHFVSEDAFEKKVAAGEFFEWERVHDRLYGTLQSTVDNAVGGHYDLLLDIDIRGASNFKSRYPKHTVIVFLLAPNCQQLLERVRSRSDIDQNEELKRLQTAQVEFQSLLDAHNRNGDFIDYVVLNDVLPEAVSEVYSVLASERLRLGRLSIEKLNSYCIIPEEKG